MNSLPCWDQKDCQIAAEALQVEATRLETILRTAGKDVPARPAQNGRAEKNYDAMTAYMAQLHALVSLSIAKPSAAAPAPASTVAAPAQAQTAAKKLTPDEKIFALHGVKNVSELNSKMNRERGLGLHPDD